MGTDATITMHTHSSYDFLIVGSGLFGATFARLATDAGHRCLVIDKRSHTGGNVHCDDIDGITVHRYGPHVFHTKNKEVWQFVNRFVEMNRFTLCPMANYNGEIYNLPFNMNTFHQLWGVTTPQEAEAIIDSQRHRGAPRNLEEQALSLVGSDVYERLVRGYTEKQWGRPCYDLPPSIIRRLPIRLTYDNNYFDDPYQGVPTEGYNALIDKLLQVCDVRTDCDFFHGMHQQWRQHATMLVFTGKTDDFYGCRFGALQYRSLHFETETLNMPNYQGVAQINFTDSATPYTRIIEHKHFTMFGNDVYNVPHTVITREYPQEYWQGQEPYYPINDEANTNLYARYQTLADKESDIIFGGRLAEYKYYDMDKTIVSAMHKWQEWQENRH